MAVWFLLSVAVVCSVYDKSIMPALVVLAPVAAIAILAVIMERDIRKAFIEIIDNHIAVTDFYLDLKAEKTFSVSEIGTAEITSGYSMRVRGYRYSHAGCTYIIFRNKDSRYMFKVICVPETRQYFSKYLN